MFLGTQVRESTDYLLKQGVERINLIDQLGIPFIIHRSFSWLVLILILYISWKNEKQEKYLLIRLSLITLAIELFSGVLLAYFELPGLVQTAHLIFATILLGVLWMFALRMKSKV
jgi:cytochrome c oxidase assembly protein subunit 15